MQNSDNLLDWEEVESLIDILFEELVVEFNPSSLERYEIITILENYKILL